MANSELYEVFWPGGPSAVHTVPAAPRSDLTGKRIGFLWDYVFRGEEIFPILEKSISKRYKNVEFVSYENFGSTFGGFSSPTWLPKSTIFFQQIAFRP